MVTAQFNYLRNVPGETEEYHESLRSKHLLMGWRRGKNVYYL